MVSIVAAASAAAGAQHARWQRSCHEESAGENLVVPSLARRRGSCLQPRVAPGVGNSTGVLYWYL